MKITKPTLTKIETYSKRLGKPVDYLTEQFEELYGVMSKKHPTRSPVSLESSTLVELRGYLRRIDRTLVRSSAVMFRGVILGDSGVLDLIDLMIKKQEGMFNRGGTSKAHALRRRLVNKEGKALDGRKSVWTNGKQEDNPNYGYPVSADEHAYQRTLYGVAGKGETMESPKVFQLRYKGEYALNVDYPLWKVVDFRAGLRDEATDYLLNSTSVTSFKQPDTKVDLAKLIRSCGRKVWGIHELDEVHTFFRGDERKMRETPQLFEADLQQVNNEPDRFNNRIFFLDNESLFLKQDFGVKFQFPNVVPIENSSKLIAIGYPSKVTSRNGDEYFVLKGYGYYPFPDFKRYD